MLQKVDTLVSTWRCRQQYPMNTKESAGHREEKKMGANEENEWTSQWTNVTNISENLKFILACCHCSIWTSDPSGKELQFVGWHI